MSLLLTAALAAFLLSCGGRFAALYAEAGDGPGLRSVWGLVAGLVGLHLTLLALDLAAVPWTLARALLPLAFAALVAPRFVAAPPAIAAAKRRAGWGDLLAVAALAAFVIFAAKLWIAGPDFVYHWGLKGHKFYLLQGIDWSYLALPWNSYVHPDYPNLLPGLFATTAMAAGEFDQRAMLFWSAICFGAVLLTARDLAARLNFDSVLAHSFLALLAAALLMFGIPYQMSGIADWLPALALLAAIPALLGRPTPQADLQIALAAALAAAGKIEGVALGFFLVVVYSARCWLASRRWEPGRILRSGLLPLLVVLPWLWRSLQFDLLQHDNTGILDWARLSTIAGALRELLTLEGRTGWHYWTPVIVLLIPLLALRRATRPLGIVVLSQLLFYFFVYLTAPVDTRLYVLTSFSRLLFQLVPAVVVGSCLLLDAWGRSAAAAPPSEDAVATAID